MHKLIAPLIVFALFGLVMPGYCLSSSVTYPSSALCGNSASGFDKWRISFKKMALDQGISQTVLNDTLDDIAYNSRVAHLDRNQKSYKLSFDQFMEKRNADYIVSKGRRLKEQNLNLFRRIQERYGVPPGILLAIWGMESSFGRHTGKMNAIRSLATLAYDCRRTAFFTRELLAALMIVQKGYMRPNQMTGAWAGEMGQTQFLASNYLKYAVDFDGDGRRDLIHSKADALASTANFLVSFGWKAGKGYQPGQPNYSAIKEWNYAEVYQKALAAIAKRIDSQDYQPEIPTKKPALFFDRLSNQ